MLVDAAFLAHALLRAPQALFASLPEVTRERLHAALRSTRTVQPGFNNWLLFSAMVEAALLRFTGEVDLMRIDYAVRQHEQWYKGDGAYGDGPNFHWDYYNSFVIQPMLLDVLDVAAPRSDAWKKLLLSVRDRARRLAAVLERLIAPDGTFPPIGRSLAYRCGAFQHLAQMALQHDLPDETTPAQARCALDAVIRRTLDVPGTFDAAGWLRIGVHGSQPNLGKPTSAPAASICAPPHSCPWAFLRAMPSGSPRTSPGPRCGSGVVTISPPTMPSDGGIPLSHFSRQTPDSRGGTLVSTRNEKSHAAALIPFLRHDIAPLEMHLI
ncbi:MAG: hypothetical protein K0R17_3982 [Rariglobus sp.]|nr:hypothetical protein [Rariglobus sp.]